MPKLANGQKINKPRFESEFVSSAKKQELLERQLIKKQKNHGNDNLEKFLEKSKQTKLE